MTLYILILQKYISKLFGFAMMHRHMVRNKILQYSVANNVNDIWFARSFILLFFFRFIYKSTSFASLVGIFHWNGDVGEFQRSALMVFYT